MPITHRWDGTVLTITSDSGTSSADLKGAKGDDGARGAQGVAGSCIAEDTAKLGGIVAGDYATKAYVDTAILNADIDLTDYATKTYVDTAVDNVDLSNYYTKTEINTTVSDINRNIEYYATKDYVDSKAPAHNLLDNSDFRNPVNQRGQTSYDAVGYTFDRWVIQNTGSVIKVGNGGLQAGTSGSLKYLYQRVFLEEGKTYTLASETTDGDLCVITAVYNKASSWTWIKEANTNSKIYLGIASSGADFATVAFSNGTNTNVYTKWIALYEGAYTAETLPPYVPKGYAVELAECQRYYYQYPNDTSVYGYTGSGGTSAYMIFELPAVMRLANPTVSLGDRIHVAFGGAGALQLTSISSSKIVGKQLQLTMPLPNAQATNTVCAGWTSKVIAVSADL